VGALRDAAGASSTSSTCFCNRAAKWRCSVVTPRKELGRRRWLEAVPSPVTNGRSGRIIQINRDGRAAELRVRLRRRGGAWPVSSSRGLSPPFSGDG